ncbi:MAG TPA: dipeptide epimerase [Candidatus Elarobacter sp.]|jgi:L-alanine-DL-glutamate epimerase-like enolase superfamily enzyme
MPITLTVEPLDLPLKHTFTIARSSESVAKTAVVHLRWNRIEGLGESAPSERYDENVASVSAGLEALYLGDDPYALERLLHGLPPAQRCGLDIALHDLIGKDLDRPLWRLLGLDPARTPRTSFTIGIAPLDQTLAKVREVGSHPVIKVKLGTGAEIETVEAIRSIYTGAIRVDANEGWTPERAVNILSELAKFEIEFCEQPIPAGAPAKLRWIRERSSIPIVTDEDSKDANDLPALLGCVDGINVKLVKCGGIRGALEMIHTARAMGLKIMLGCMIESQILTTAAAHLSPLADWADLDGPFLTSHDPFSGITYTDGKIVLPDGPGLGVRETAPVDTLGMTARG